MHIKLLICILLLGINGAGFAQTVDKKATKETRKLYKNLKKLVKRGIMFGHQDDLAYGIGWRDVEGRSDVKEVAGQLPAVFGWEVAGLEKDSPLNIDSVPFLKMKQYIRQVYDMGLINTMTWHLDNPFNGKSAWDTKDVSISSILPGGSKNQMYNTWLDKFAVFILDLKGSDGKPIPILFRPYHELTGSWFWWGKNLCTPQEYKQLWIYTYHYLQDKGIHNLIYVYNTSSIKTHEEFVERYPGDAYVDMVSCDAYDSNSKGPDSKFITETDKSLTIVEEFGKAHKKLPALAETGYEAIPDSEWWTKVLWKAMENHKLSYVLVWRNAGYQPENKKHHYYAPYKGSNSEKDFLELIKTKPLLLQNGIQKKNIYK
jgi:hypothetical protein